MCMGIHLNVKPTLEIVFNCMGFQVNLNILFKAYNS
jgi:hypothetical protein